jgi:PAS domain S-box-containing protein
MVNQRLNAEMKEARDHFELLFSTSPNAVLITRASDNHCQEVNRAFEDFSGYTREEILGRTALDVGLYKNPSDRDRLLEGLRSKGHSDNIEISFRRKDGSEVDCIVSSRIVSIRDVPHVISVAQDITDRKRAEETLKRNESEIRDLNAGLERRVAKRTEELQVANRNLEALVYSMAHDLRAPLRAIDGFSGILETEHASSLDEEGRRLLRVVRAGAQTGDRLLGDLLEYSHTAFVDLRQVPVDMAAMANAAYTGIATPAVLDRFRFTVGELPAATGDPALLSLVWSNLLTNAVKHTMPRSERHIEVGAVPESTTVTYWVRDNGVGFNPAYAHKLFGVFQRLHAIDEFEGTGIGLAIVKRIVERHGGRVWAEGAPDAGATFFFSLPRAAEPARAS